MDELEHAHVFVKSHQKMEPEHEALEDIIPLPGALGGRVTCS